MTERLVGIVARHGRLIRLVSAGIMVLSIIGLLRALPVVAWIESLKDHAAALGPWAPVGFVVLFVGLTVVCLPGVPLNVLSGVVFGPVAGWLLTALASNASAAVSFLISRYLARRKAAELVEHYPRVKAVYHSMADKGSWKIVAAVRLSHALPFGLQNFLLGLTPVGFGPYLLTTWAVTFPGMFMLAYFGYIGAVSLSAAQDSASLSTWQWLARAGGLVAAAGAIVYLGHLVRQRIQEGIGELAPPAEEATDAPGRSGLWATLGLALTSLGLLIVAVFCHVAKMA
jgi:uncharacterized membrane protein YdjX (TVP38/TMEM64 family)